MGSSRTRACEQFSTGSTPGAHGELSAGGLLNPGRSRYRAQPGIVVGRGCWWLGRAGLLGLRYPRWRREDEAGTRFNDDRAAAAADELRFRRSRPTTFEDDLLGCAGHKMSRYTWLSTIQMRLRGHGPLLDSELTMLRPAKVLFWAPSRSCLRNRRRSRRGETSGSSIRW